jgi:hypothetical protein
MVRVYVAYGQVTRIVYVNGNDCLVKHIDRCLNRVAGVGLRLIVRYRKDLLVDRYYPNAMASVTARDVAFALSHNDVKFWSQG